MRFRNVVVWKTLEKCVLKAQREKDRVNRIKLKERDGECVCVCVRRRVRAILKLFANIEFPPNGISFDFVPIQH